MHLSKLPSGTWRVTVRRAGERRTATARTRTQAQQLGAELLLELGGGGRVVERRTTVAEMLLTHLAEQADNWSPTFHHDASGVVHRLITEQPGFTNRRVRDVTPVVVLTLYRDLDRTGWTRWRVKRLHTVMRTAFQMAVHHEWANTNPCREIAPPTPETGNINPPTDAQVQAILAELDGPELLAVRINLTLGIRRGDLVGLQWSDVDFDRAEILIARSLAYTPGNIHVMPTKAGKRSHRRLVLDLPTLAMLRRWKAEQTERAVANGLPAPIWILSSDAGVTPWRPDRVSRIFRHARQRADITGVRLHDLRHYVATSMLNDGDSVHDVAGMLGNTPAVVESTYRHWTPGRGRESVERRAARLDSR